MILEDKDKRHDYMCQQLRMYIAYQVRLLRLQREFTQDDIAKATNISVQRIKKIEDWDADFLSIKQLEKIASVFDCALMVHFTGWEEIIEGIIPDYKEDAYFKEESK